MNDLTVTSVRSSATGQSPATTIKLSRVLLPWSRSIYTCNTMPWIKQCTKDYCECVCVCGFSLVCVYHHISLNLSVTLKQASIVYSVAILPAFIALNDCSEVRVPWQVPCSKCQEMWNCGCLFKGVWFQVFELQCWPLVEGRLDFSTAFHTSQSLDTVREVII